jgi:ADP-heptose:LPS heptosyltransferase
MMRRALVIHPGSLGDVLLAVPALAHLRALGLAPVLAAAPRIAALLADTGVTAGALDLDGLGLGPLFTGDASPATLAAFRDHHAVVSWMGAGDPTFRAALARLSVPVVVARSAPPPGSGVHVADHLLATLLPLGPPPARCPEVRLAVRGTDRAWAGAWLAERGLPEGDVVLVHPGAGNATKAWPGFPALVRALRADGAPVVVSLGEADAHVARELAAGELPGRLVVADRLAPGQLAALAATARVFAGNDSGPTHLAALAGCPTVAVFGPTDPGVWAPRGRHVRVVRGEAGVAGPWPALETVAGALGAAGGWPDGAGPPRRLMAGAA